MTNNQENIIFSHFPNVAFNVVTIAASVGGLNAISDLLSALPSDFPAAIIIVQHLSSNYPSYMAEILSSSTALQVKQAEVGDLLRPGTVYVAVPNFHLAVNPNGTLSFSNGAKVNFVRPSADVLFRSVASSYKARAIAIVLTGRGSDGVLGVLAIKKHGGTVIAQNEDSCQCFDMPSAAINTGKVDFVLPPKAIASTLVNLLMVKQIASPKLRLARVLSSATA